MICENCKKEMKYFQDRKTCGWKCITCDNFLVTTYDDGINADESLYSIHILAKNDTTAINIKTMARVCNCSFIEAKELLVTGKVIEELSAIQTRDILKLLKSSDIHFSTDPDFLHQI